MNYKTFSFTDLEMQLLLSAWANVVQHIMAW